MAGPVRALARSLNLGQFRERVRAAPWWVAVPARRIKDLAPGRSSLAHSVALTFDDGPDPVVTPRLLELLESQSVRATFFMCGLAAQRHPDLVRNVAAAGHTVAGHSWDHRQIFRLPAHEWRRQIDDTHRLLEDLSDRPIRWFRPPRGRTDRFTRETLRQRGVTTVHWSASGQDWKLREPEAIAGEVLADLEPGAIVLLHDAIGDFLSTAGPPPSQEPTIEATDLILRVVKDEGLEPVALDDLSSVRTPSFGRPLVRGAHQVSPSGRPES